MQQIAIYLLWVLWAISWVAAAGWSSATKRRAPFREELISRGFTGAGVLLLFGIYSPRYISVISLWHVGELTGWLLVLLAIAGFALTWWARIHMRTLWSGTITVKNEHHVVNTGPYRYVRHPIYTGLIVASFATAIDRGTFVAMAGAVLMLAGWFTKARFEEFFLRTELGADAYDSYARATAMFIPFVKL